MKKTNKKGFTLIELIVVIAILAVLGLLLVPQITGYIKASKDAVGTANAKACYSSLAVQAANKEANLNITVTVDEEKCAAIGDPMTGASWTEKEGRVYTFDGKTVTVPK